MASDVPPIPHQTPVTDENGKLTHVWFKFFQQLFTRIGGNLGTLLENPMTLAGDIIFGGSGGAASRLAGNTTTTKKFLSQTGTGTASATPAWAALAVGDVFAAQTKATYFGGPYSGADAAPTFKAFQAPTVQKFTSGTGTYTTPAGVLYLRVRMVGGGGGGAGGGTAGGTAAGAGGDTTFGSILTAHGGAAGPYDVACSVTVAAGGTATMSSPAVGTALTGASGNGPGGVPGTAGSRAEGPPGASSPLGGAGAGCAAGNAPAGSSDAVANTGSGGGGGANNNNASGSSGGSGAAGAWIDCIVPSPSGTYAYAIGAKGTAGGAGTSGFAGGAGSLGYIEVTEHYQ